MRVEGDLEVLEEWYRWGNGCRRDVWPSVKSFGKGSFAFGGLVTVCLTSASVGEQPSIDLSELRLRTWSDAWPFRAARLIGSSRPGTEGGRSIFISLIQRILSRVATAHPLLPGPRLLSPVYTPVRII